MFLDTGSTIPRWVSETRLLSLKRAKKGAFVFVGPFAQRGLPPSTPLDRDNPCWRIGHGSAGKGAFLLWLASTFLIPAVKDFPFADFSGVILGLSLPILSHGDYTLFAFGVTHQVPSSSRVERVSPRTEIRWGNFNRRWRCRSEGTVV
jgi:hypothetical protein